MTAPKPVQFIGGGPFENQTRDWPWPAPVLEFPFVGRYVLQDEKRHGLLIAAWEADQGNEA